MVQVVLGRNTGASFLYLVLEAALTEQCGYRLRYFLAQLGVVLAQFSMLLPSFEGSTSIIRMLV